ncbi:hypothetical protein GCM10007096_11530 [Pullulanibacillus pueri]|uniref:Uncharacterized protein n=1 Tax=Pullulanibacillus pueri TaxID=1437324 RepID=A0A8J2ZTZ4_9BACL|nr:hypothetical protein GCM10007096_11530 [Pullulanibacillus pueri]
MAAPAEDNIKPNFDDHCSFMKSLLMIKSNDVNDECRYIMPLFNDRDSISNYNTFKAVLTH